MFKQQGLFFRVAFNKHTATSSVSIHAQTRGKRSIRTILAIGRGLVFP